MAPEYGATIGYFPQDAEAMNYLRLTNRSADKIELIQKSL
jgi:aconitate hydratase